jgi:hypothetical protein
MPDSEKVMNWAAKPANQDRVKYFFQGDAIAVSNESSPADYKLSFAKKVLYGEMSIYQLTIGVTTNPTINATIVAGDEPSDSDLDYTCETMFEPFAKAGSAT